MKGTPDQRSEREIAFYRLLANEPRWAKIVARRQGILDELPTTADLREHFAGNADQLEKARQQIQDLRERRKIPV